MTKRQIAFLQIFVTAMLWGSTFVLFRFGLKDIGPFTLAGLRFTAAGLMMLPILKLKGFSLKEYSGDYWKLAILGFFSFSVGNGFLAWGLQYLPSTTVALLTNLIDPLILFFSIFWLKEIPKPIQLVGVAAALAGIFLYFYPQAIPWNNPGMLLIGISLLGFSSYSLFGRYLARSQTFPFWIQTAFPFIFGGIGLLITAFFTESAPQFTAPAVLSLGWMIVFNSIIGYSLYNQAISHLSAVEINIMLKMAPFSTALIAWLLMGEKLSFLQITGLVIVIFGILLVQMGHFSIKKLFH